MERKVPKGRSRNSRPYFMVDLRETQRKSSLVVSGEAPREGKRPP